MSAMNCEEIDRKLVFYLDQTLAPGERLLIERHLAGCEACRARLDATRAARALAAEALQSRAAHAELSAQAWDLLQNRLAREAHHSPAWNRKVWNARKAPRAGRTSIIHTLLGGNTMNKRTIFSAVMAVAAVAVVGVLLLRQATPVSARQIIEKAYQASSAPEAAQGIRHTISEHTTNKMVMSAGNWAETVRSESYVNLANGIYRSVSTDAATGELLNASAYDGSYMYTNREAESLEKGRDPFILYRTAQSLDKIAGLMPSANPVDPKAMFEQMRAQADSVEVSPETDASGRKVYILHTKLSDNAGEKFGIQGLAGESRVVIDAKSYELLGDSLVSVKDGKEETLTSYRVITNELLPADSQVAWDLSDVKGIQFVDDPDRIHGDLLPEKITPEELAGHTSTAYLLEKAPEGFTLTLSAPPQQTNEVEYFWMADYRDASGDYFLVQGGEQIPASVIEAAQDVVHTKSGLTLRIDVFDENLPEGMNPQVMAYVSGPEGEQFMISSNLPRERVVELAEGLVKVK